MTSTLWGVVHATCQSCPHCCALLFEQMNLLLRCSRPIYVRFPCRSLAIDSRADTRIRIRFCCRLSSNLLSAQRVRFGHEQALRPGDNPAGNDRSQGTADVAQGCACGHEISGPVLPIFVTPTSTKTLSNVRSPMDRTGGIDPLRSSSSLQSKRPSALKPTFNKGVEQPAVTDLYKPKQIAGASVRTPG